MTIEQKKALIEKESEMYADEMTKEERAFLALPWDHLTDEERELYYQKWENDPDSLEYAALHAECTKSDLLTAEKVLRAIRNKWIDAGASPDSFDIETTGEDLLSLLERIGKTRCRSVTIIADNGEEAYYAADYIDNLMAERTGPIEVHYQVIGEPLDGMGIDIGHISPDDLDDLSSRFVLI